MGGMLNDAPIRVKLRASLLIISVAVLLMMCAAFGVHDYLTLRRNTLRQIDAVAEILAVNSTGALAFTDREDAAEVLRALDRERHMVGACLFDAAGEVFAVYPTGAKPGVFPAAPGKEGFAFSDASVRGFQPVVQKGHRLGTLYLDYDARAMVLDWVRSSAAAAAAVAIVVLAIAYLMSRLLEQRISAPILALAATAQAVSEQQDFSVRAVKHGRDELGQLTDTFNGMLDRLQRFHQELEQRVRDRTAQLEAANRELEAFSYSVSHDLRAPLRHIDGFAALLRKHAGAALDEKGRRLLGTIAESAKLMGRLIDDLLAFSRISRSQLSTCEVDQNALVSAVIRDGRFESEGPAIEWSVAPLPPVRADSALLRQVWVNLIANAVKYSARAQPPRISISNVSQNGEHVFAVQDNGVGFDMAYVDKLFGVFQRLHSQAEFEGTGIGLANVRRIVSRHGGRTWAEGRVGEGATFYFSLPRSAPKSSS